MLRQYRALKARYPDALLLFRLGDFYELFGPDAEIGASVLSITLTGREVGKGQRLPMCGVPARAVDAYVARLVQAGHRVAICDQLEDPRRARGVVRRDVVRIVTPGTVLEDEPSAAPGQEGSLAGAISHYLVAVHAEPPYTTAGLAAVALATGEFRVTRLEASGPQALAERLLEELRRLHPSECLVAPWLLSAWPGWRERLERGEARTAVTAWESDAWHLPRARRLLLEQLQVSRLDAFGCETWPEAQVAAGAALGYLQETQRSGPLAHLTRLESYRPEGGLYLDPATMANLELRAPLRQGGDRRASLLAVLDMTRSGPGARLLRRWLEEPLQDLEAIHRRLDAVEALVQQTLRRARLRELLGGLPDPERLMGRVGCGRAGPRDLAGLREFLARLDALAAAAGSVEGPLNAVVGGLQPMAELRERLARALVDEPPVQVGDSPCIREGFDAALDALRAGARDGRDWIAGLEARERQRTGIRSLKVGYHRVFGYYLEVTRANLHLVPPEYQRSQTLAGVERFVTPELKEWESRVLDADQRIQAREQALFDELVADVAARSATIQANIRVVAELDALAALAEVAVRRRWVRPEVDDGTAIVIRGGRHPVVEALQPDPPFVPNHVTLDINGEHLAIVTGPNMGGKSTYLRQTALIVLLAHMGSFVPAASARIGRVDRILTRVGAWDDLGAGRSTFLVEMGETAYILRHATPRSLVILDEVGRGTSTYDGVSLAWAIVEDLARRRVRTMVATHFQELTRLSEAYPGVINLHVAAVQADGTIRFLREVHAGPADRSYGIEVARLAGLPEPVVARAAWVLARLESGVGGRARGATAARRPTQEAARAAGRGPLQGRLFAADVIADLLPAPSDTATRAHG